MAAPTPTDRRDLAWIGLIQVALRDEACPPTLEAALSCMEAAAVPLSSPSGRGTYAALSLEIEDIRAAWRTGDEWGARVGGLQAGFVASDAHGRRTPLLPSLGLVAPAYAATNAFAEELALAIACYTIDDPKLFQTLNTEMSSANRLDGIEIGPRLRACLPYVKLLQTALEGLPSAFIFGSSSPTVDPSISGRVWRAVGHVFPGYPGYVNPQGGPSPQQHEPERHFPVGSTVCWYQFNSCSRNLQGVMDFAAVSGYACSRPARRV